MDNTIVTSDMTYIYLDYNASAPLLPEAWKAMEPFLKTHDSAHNASAVHHFGRVGNRAIENARTDVANLVGADKNQVIFNSGATEGNNTILRYFSENCPNDTILICATEHPSIGESINILKNVKIIPVDKNGLIKPNILEDILEKTPNVSIISCQYVNNESGAIQNVSELINIAHKYGCLFHCDATQAAGRIPINMQEICADFLTLSSHKIGGPQGVGALVLGICGQTPSLLFGGGQEKYARAGTQNVAGIAGFGAACKYALNNLDKYQQLETLRDRLEKQLKEISPEIIIHCQNIPRVANTSFFSIKSANAQNLLIALDLEKIAISNGSACSSGSVKPSATLKSMGCDEKTSSSALRISMGWATKESDIDAFIDAWKKIYTRIKNNSQNK